MLKKLLSIALCAFSFISQAQPTMNYVSPTVGDTTKIYLPTYQITSTYPTSGNQTWDFSTYGTDPVSFVSVFENPATTAYATSFPTADWAAVIYSGTQPFIYIYGKISTDSSWTLGQRSPAFPSMDFDYIDYEVGYRFPYNLNDINNDISSTTLGEHDTTQEKYVGYGSIKTPYSTYNNVVLIEKKVKSLGVWEISSYKWVTVGNFTTVAEIDYQDSTVVWQENKQTFSAIEEAQWKEKYNLNIYPNPSRGSAQISYDLESNEKVAIELISANGQYIKTLVDENQWAGSHSIPLNTLQLSAGVYFLRVGIGGKQFSDKFVIE
ncbi:MAG: T9SS type A sorting domain-containing protein [Chitinophagaceae bacterium]